MANDFHKKKTNKKKYRKPVDPRFKKPDETRTSKPLIRNVPVDNLLPDEK